MITFLFQRCCAYTFICLFIASLFTYNITAQPTSQQPLDVMMFLDRGNKSDPTRPADIICTDFSVALVQQAAPIITTGTVLHSFLNRKLAWNKKSSKWKRFITLLYQRFLPNSWFFSEKFNSKKMHKRRIIFQNFLHLIFSEIPFTDENFEIFEYEQEDMFLIIPNLYKEKLHSKIPSLGFSIPLLKKISIKELEESVALETWSPLARKHSITATSIARLFIPNKRFGPWHILIDGHGMYENKGFQASISGINLEEFKQLVMFFEQSLSTSFLYYLSCYGGGYNTSLLFIEKIINPVKKIALSMPINFIVASAAPIDAPTAGAMVGIRKTSSGQKNTQLCTKKTCPKSKVLQSMKSPYDFNNFFTTLHTLLSQPQTIEKKQWLELFKFITPERGPENIPLIKLPGKPFVPITGVNENAKFLSHEKTTKHEQENRPVVIKKADKIKSLLVAPPVVNAHIHIENPSDFGFVSLQPGAALHYFKEIFIKEKNRFLNHDYLKNHLKKDPSINKQHLSIKPFLMALSQLFLTIPKSWMLSFNKYFVIKKLVINNMEFKNIFIKRNKESLLFTVLFQWDNSYYTYSGIFITKPSEPKIICHLFEAREDFKNRANSILYEWYSEARQQWKLEENIKEQLFDDKLLEYVKDQLDIFHDAPEEEISLLSQGITRPENLLKPFRLSIFNVFAPQPKQHLAFMAQRKFELTL